VWSVETVQEFRSRTGHSGYVIFVSFSPVGTKIVSGSYDETVRVWSVETGQEIRSLTWHSGRDMSVGLSPEGTQIASVSYDNTVRVWSVETGQEIRPLTGHSGSVNTVAFSPDGTQIASDSGGKAAQLFASGFVESGMVDRSGQNSLDYSVEICQPFGSLLWSSGPCSATLRAEGCQFEQAVGLTKVNQNLLHSLK